MNKDIWQRKEVHPLGSVQMNIWGDTKTGKTSLALDFPAPLFVVNADRSMDHLLAKLGDKEYYYVDFVPHDIVGEIDEVVSKVLFNRFKEIVMDAVSGGKGTIILDGGVRVWDIVTEAFVPNKGDVPPKAYQKANKEFEDMLDKVVNSGVNLVITNQSREIWVSAGQKSGALKSGGFSRLNYWVSAVVQTKKERVRNVNGSVAISHVVEFGDNGYDTRLEGLKLKNPTFEKLYTLYHKEYNPKLYDKLWMEMGSLDE